jgi:hypothetical protein
MSACNHTRGAVVETQSQKITANDLSCIGGTGVHLQHPDIHRLKEFLRSYRKKKKKHRNFAANLR